MPVKRRSRRPANRRLRGKAAPRYKKGFAARKPTNSYYHSTIPRTLQIATRRPMTAMLRFVVNQTYMLEPKVSNVAPIGPECAYLQFRANSIVDIMHGTNGNGSKNFAGTWTAQDPPNYGPTQVGIAAEGVTSWQERFQHFTVLGSKIQVTSQTVKNSPDATAAELPGTLFINLAGLDGVIDKTTQAYSINDLPYTKRARIISAVGNAPTVNIGASSVPGARLGLTYSAKKFEGVTDVLDNSSLRGHFENSVGNVAVPAEESFFTVGYVPTMPFSATTPALQSQLVTIKLEYIVKLTEPTLSNQVSHGD